MSDFDPYHKWLGISPQHQPPNHYRLLSLDLYEADPDVIEASVDRIVAFLQDVSVGPHAKESQKLLNEVAAARLRLLDKKQKAAYDEKLATELERAIWPPANDSQPPPPPVAPAVAIDTSVSSVAQPPPVRTPIATRRTRLHGPTSDAPSSTDKSTKRGKEMASPVLLLSFVSGGGLLIFATVFALFAGGNSEAKRQAAEKARVRERLDSLAEMGREPESVIPNFEFADNPPPQPTKKPNKNRKKRAKNKR